MAATLTTFWYEMDRSRCKQKFHRSRESYVARLVAVLSAAARNPALRVRAYVESEAVKQEVLGHLASPVEVMVKPLAKWTKQARHAASIQAMLDSWKGVIDTPESFSATYVCAMLSKVDAVLEHAQAAPECATHIWVDGGYRWELEALSNTLPAWPAENQLYVAESRPLKIMGGVFGGSRCAIERLQSAMAARVPAHIARAKPFTDETIMHEIVSQEPSFYTRVPLYSRGMIGNALFGSAFLEKMLPAMFQGPRWNRPLLSRSEKTLFALLALAAVLALVRLRLRASRS